MPKLDAGTAGLAGGYLFQDAVAAAIMLQVLVKGDVKFSTERRQFAGDPFDDVILHGAKGSVRIQCKNGPSHQFSNGDLTAGRLGSGGLLAHDKSARRHARANAGDRSVILTSFLPPANLATHWKPAGYLELLPGFSIPTFRYAKRIGNARIESVEVAFECPSIGTKGDTDRQTEPIHETDFFERAEECWVALAPSYDNPLTIDARDTVRRAMFAARHAAASKVRDWTAQEIARGMEVAPGNQAVAQPPSPTIGKRIEPSWVRKLKRQLSGSDRCVLVTGSPGSGKSNAVDSLTGPHALVYRLEVRTDSARQQRIRLDPARFRHQLAGQLESKFQDAGLNEAVSTPTSSIHDLNARLKRLAAWAKKSNLNPLLVVDAVDYAARVDDREAEVLLTTLAALEIPAPVSLVVLSRPLPDALQAKLRNFARMDVPNWKARDINLWLTTNGIRPTKHRVTTLLAVSSGLPVILGQLMREAAGSSRVLDSLSAKRKESRGQLTEYYAAVLAEMPGMVRDACILIAAHGAPLPNALLAKCLPGNSGTVELLSDASFNGVVRKGDNSASLFHGSFTEHILHAFPAGRLGAHERLFEAYRANWLETAQASAEAVEQAVALKREAELLSWLTPNQLETWFRAGVHEDQAREALRHILIIAAELGDYNAAMLAGHMTNACQELFSIQANVSQRQDFFKATNRTAEELRLCSGMLQQRLGSSEEELAQIPRLVRLQGPEAGRNALELWKARQRPDGDGNFRVHPRSFLHAVAAVGAHDVFWKNAHSWAKTERRETLLMVLETVATFPETFGRSTPKMPDILVKSLPAWTPNAAIFVGKLPKKWRKTIADAELSAGDPGTLHTLALAGRDIRPLVRDMSAVDASRASYPPLPGHVRHSFHRGAVLALVGEYKGTAAASSTKVAILDGLCEAIGAWTTSNGVAPAIKFIRRSAKNLDRPPLGINDVYQYGQDLAACWRAALELAGSRQSSADVEKLLRTFPAERVFAAIRASVSNLASLDKKDLPRLARRRLSLLASKPEEIGPAASLLQVGIDAFGSGDADLAGQCLRDASRSALRYGHRKDTLLQETWDALVIASDAPFEYAPDLALQLLEWARLVHSFTDGKETRHVEGEILVNFLARFPDKFPEVRAAASHPSTMDRLWKFENERLARESRDGWDEAFARVNAQSDARDRFNGFWKLAEVASGNSRKDQAIQALDFLASSRPSYELGEHQALAIRSLFQASKRAVPEWIPKPRKRPAAVNYEALPLRRLRESIAATNEAGVLLPQLEELARRGRKEEAIQQAIAGLARGGGISRFMTAGFTEIVEFMERTAGRLEMSWVMQAWGESARSRTPFAYGVAENLTMAIRRAHGRDEAIRFVSGIMSWMSRLFWPFERRIHAWGFLAANLEPGPRALVAPSSHD